MIAVIAKSAVTVTLAAAFIGHSGLAYADRIEGVVVNAPSVIVSFAELDISKPQGLEVLYSRIKTAAKSVCGFDHSIQQLSRGSDSMACYKSAVEGAVTQINRPTLTAFHRAKSKSALG